MSLSYRGVCASINDPLGDRYSFGTEGGKKLSQPAVRIFLLGPFQMTDASGRDVTPTGQKAKALLALVATAERKQRSRSWLSSKLWSDRAPAQASASLRQTLSEIRKAIGPAGRSFLKIDASSVAFDADAVVLDIEEQQATPAANMRPVSGSDFLEGIDVRDPEFEDWLSIERARWEDQVPWHGSRMPQRCDPRVQPAAAGSDGTAVISIDALASRVDILDPIVSGNAADATSLANEILLILTNLVGENEHIALIDRRSKPINQATTRSPFAIQMTVTGLGRTFSIGIAIVNSVSSRIESQINFSSGSPGRRAFDDPAILAKLHLVCDDLHRFMHQLALRVRCESAEAGKLLTFLALDDMFGISNERLLRAEKLLIQAGDPEPTSQNFAWRAYLATFKLGQRTGTFSPSDYDECEMLARRAMEFGPGNALTLALCAHVFGFVFKNHDFAADLLAKSLTLNPHRALTWDLYAVLHSYTGQPEKGLKCAKWARAIGGFSPYAYFYDTSCCMNSALAGYHEEAVEFGIKALNLRPNFSPALRYLVSSLGHLRQPEQSQIWVERLIRSEPEFTADGFLRGGHLQLPVAQADLIRKGFELAGAPIR